MSNNDLTAEHLRLVHEVEQLQKEHDTLEQQRPPDAATHAEHKAKLQAKIRELQSHLQRLQQQRRDI